MTGTLGNQTGRGQDGSLPVHPDYSDSDGEEQKFDGEDKFMPYNQQLKQQGITFNEWKDKKYEWDL